METNWAAEHLQVIRTLMERSALYRRALAPIMVFNGVVGLAAAGVGIAAHITSTRSFILYWATVALVGLTGSLLLVRRQALKEAEPFWSPPTRRVSQALLPPLTAGLFISVVVLLSPNPELLPGTDASVKVWLPLSWVILYGCAFHAAGFFMPRGMRLFGWGFIIAGCSLFALGALAGKPHPSVCAHGVMAIFFGALHLVYGVYLYFTERRGTAP